MTGFVKIYESILDSSIWGEAPATRLVWITMLAMADQHGIVEASIGGLARRAQVSRKDCEKALLVLSSPDTDDKSGVDEGRRIQKVDRGWHITNHRHYRELRTDKQAKTTERVRRFRQRQRSVTVTPVTPGSAPKRPEAEAEADLYQDAAAKDLEDSARGSGVQRAAAVDLESVVREFAQAVSAEWRRPVAIGEDSRLARLLGAFLARGTTPADLAAAGTEVGRWLRQPGRGDESRCLAMVSAEVIQRGIDDSQEAATEGASLLEAARARLPRKATPAPAGALLAALPGVKGSA